MSGARPAHLLHLSSGAFVVSTMRNCIFPTPKDQRISHTMLTLVLWNQGERCDRSSHDCIPRPALSQPPMMDGYVMTSMVIARPSPPFAQYPFCARVPRAGVPARSRPLPPVKLMVPTSRDWNPTLTSAEYSWTYRHDFGVKVTGRAKHRS